MFTLKHYYYRPISGNSRFKSSKEGNTFSTAIEQVKILQINTVVPAPRAQPTMKSIQQTPPSQKGKSSVGAKRPSSLPPTEASPSLAKKKRVEGKNHYLAVANTHSLVKASSSTSTINTSSETPAEDIDCDDKSVDDVERNLT
jgi:hypothetical protein